MLLELRSACANISTSPKCKFSVRILTLLCNKFSQSPYSLCYFSLSTRFHISLFLLCWNMISLCNFYSLKMYKHVAFVGCCGCKELSGVRWQSTNFSVDHVAGCVVRISAVFAELRCGDVATTRSLEVIHKSCKCVSGVKYESVDIHMCIYIIHIYVNVCACNILHTSIYIYIYI